VTGFDEFRAARTHYTSIVKRLQTLEMGKREHGEVEAYPWEQGTESLRRLLRGHLDLRCRRKKRLDSVVGRGGVGRGQVRETTPHVTPITFCPWRRD